MGLLLDDLGVLLAAGGIGTVGTTLFLGVLPEDPDACVAVLEGPGAPPDGVMRTAAGQTPCEQPRVQVLCRAAKQDYTAARTKAEAAFKLLDGLPGQTINGTRYLAAMALQSPYLIARDGNERPIVGFNVQLYKALGA